MNRRSFLGGIAASTLAASCTPPVVRRIESTPIVPDPRGGTVIFIDAGRTRYGEVWLGDSQRILGACASFTHFTVLLAPGRHFLIAFDDDSYDAAEADIAPGAIYSAWFEHAYGELEIKPLVPGRDPIKRMLDDTDRVMLARQPKRVEVDEFERRVRLAKVRYDTYDERQRAKRTIGAAHVWPS